MESIRDYLNPTRDLLATLGKLGNILAGDSLDPRPFSKSEWTKLIGGIERTLVGKIYNFSLDPVALTVEKDPDQFFYGEPSVIETILFKLIHNACKVSPEIAELAKAAVKPYLSPDIEADQDQLIEAVDKRIAGSMKAILHHPDFQAIESAWCALDFLVTRLDTGTDLKLYLLDISFDEFKADLHSHEDFRSTALYKLLVEQTVGTSGGMPWAVLVGNFIFDFVSVPRLHKRVGDENSPTLISWTR